MWIPCVLSTFEQKDMVSAIPTPTATNTPLMYNDEAKTVDLQSISHLEKGGKTWNIYSGHRSSGDKSCWEEVRKELWFLIMRRSLRTQRVW